jgi:two-component sensor histidine kinase
MNEILTDRLSAALPDGASLRVTIVVRNQPEGILLEVRDNGIPCVGGSAASEPSAALSMQIVKALVHQLGGVLEKGRDVENFCRFIIPQRPHH